MINSQRSILKCYSQNIRLLHLRLTKGKFRFVTTRCKVLRNTLLNCSQHVETVNLTRYVCNLDTLNFQFIHVSFANYTACRFYVGTLKKFSFSFCLFKEKV